MPFDVVLSKKDLFKLLERCHGVADKKSAVPALANVLLTAEERTLRVAATDLYLAISGTAEAEVNTGGAIAVPAKDLFERVRAMPDGPVQITTNTDGGQAIVKAVGHARRYTLHALRGEDFPQLPKPAPDARVIEMPLDLFALLMTRTHFSISTDETRAHVNSALFECVGDRVRMVTTDGHRLSKMEATVSGASATATMLIPLKAISELRRLTDQAKSEKIATLTIQQSGPNAFFTVAGMMFSVKLVDAQFPPYQQVIPSSVSKTVQVPRLPFIDALKAIQIAASERTGGIKLTFVPGALRITSESPESGNAFDEIAVDYSGPEMAIGFNAKYILDALGAIDEEEVKLGLSGELDPMIVTPTHADDLFIGVQMPLRL
jgi:DNA polymerase-3 subunit beta